MSRTQRTIIIVVMILLLVISSILILWFFPVCAQKQSGNWKSIQYDLGFLGIGVDLDNPIALFDDKEYAILSNEDDFVLLLQQLKSYSEYVYVDDRPVANDNCDWDALFQDIASSNLFSDDYNVLAVNVHERYGGAAKFDASLGSCYFRGNRAWVKVHTQELAASTASFNGIVYLIPCPKGLSTVSVDIDRNVYRYDD